MIAELSVLHLDRDESALPRVLPTLVNLLSLESIVFATFAQRAVGTTVERFESASLPNASRFKRALAEMLESMAHPFGTVDPLVPEAEQPNVVVQIHATELVSRVLEPLGLGDKVVTRVLLCDQDRLLGWLGGFTSAPLSPAQKEMFASLVPALRKRLVVEARLAQTPRIRATLDVTLEHIGVPAFVADREGRVFEHNGAARRLIDARRDDVAASIVSLATGKRPRIPFITTTIADDNPHSGAMLAVLRPRTADEKAELFVSLASTRWKLTKRQREILALLIRGEGNALIAEALGVSSRAVEQHISAILDRAGVDNRASLVAAVLLA